MEEFLSFLKKKGNLANLVLVGILIVSIPLSVGLVQKQQILKSRALDEVIKFTGPNVILKDGKKVAIKPKIAIQLSSPFGPPDYKLGSKVKSKSSLPSLNVVGKVYGQEDDGDEGDDSAEGGEGGEGNGDDGADVGADDASDDGKDDVIVETDEDGKEWAFLGGDPEEKDENGNYVNWRIVESKEFDEEGRQWAFLGGDPEEVDENGNYVNWRIVRDTSGASNTCTDNCDNVTPAVPTEERREVITGFKTQSGHNVIAIHYTDKNGVDRVRFILDVGSPYGGYDIRPSQRPYPGIEIENMTEEMKTDVRRWEENPYYLVWRFEVEAGPENYWAGWGPPPKGWTNRIDIPHIVNDDGTWTYFGDALPWPPAGDPGDIGAWSDPLLLGSITAEEFVTLSADEIRQRIQQKLDELWAQTVSTASFGDEIPLPTPTRIPPVSTSLPGGDKTVKTQCNGVRSWNQICSELKTAGWPGNCAIGDDMLDVYNRTSCGSRYVPPKPSPTTITTTSNAPVGAKPPIASLQTTGSQTSTTSSTSGSTTISLGPLSPYTNECINPANANNTLCKSETVQQATCSFYQSCYEAGAGGTGGTQLCTSIIKNNLCSQDPAIVKCDPKCNKAIVTQSGQSGTASPVLPQTLAATTAVPKVTTLRYRIADNPADLASTPWTVYAAENNSKTSRAPWLAYTEPLVINLEFKDKTPGTKFFFVEFEDSNGRRGGCGADGNSPCIASIVYDPTVGQTSNCKIENRSLADIFPTAKGDGVVNVNDASFLIKQISTSSKESRADINKDGVTNTCDFSLIQTNFGKI